jgi:hypothetical protein
MIIIFSINIIIHFIKLKNKLLIKTLTCIVFDKSGF